MKKIYINLFLVTILLFSSSLVVLASSELKFEAGLSGAQEVTDPSGGVATDTTGTIEVEFDKALTNVKFRIAVNSGSGITQAHFHCASAGVNGPVVAFLFGPVDPPVDVADGSVEVTLVNSDIISPDTLEVCDVPLNNIASLAFAMRAGKIYTNVHSTTFPAGVIRGQLLESDDDDNLNQP